MNETKIRLSIMFLVAGLVVGGLVLNVSAEDAKFGEIIGEYQGVVAISNGIYTGTGTGEWQCAEYVDRFYEEAMGIPGAKKWIANGKQYYGKASEFGLTAHPNGGSVFPYPCDLLCFGGGKWGHVAIVTGVDDNYIHIIEQNWNRSYAHNKLKWNKDTNKIDTRGSYYIQGWLRKDFWNFNTPTNAEGWEAVNVKEFSVNGGRYFINPKQNNPHIQSAPISLNAIDYNAIEINMASNCPDGNATIYFTTEDLPNYAEDKNVSFEVNNSGNWDNYTIYMGNHKLWNGTITGIRIDPADEGRASGVDTVGFDWIKVVETDKKPTIVSCDLDDVLYQGSDTLTFGYWIKNPFANDLQDVRLGAQIRTSNPLIEWIDDSSNDKVVVLNSGTYEDQRRYERDFKLPIFASAGEYDARWVALKHKTGVWYDNKEKINAFVIDDLSPTKPEADVIIAFDTTGSMGPYIEGAQASAVEIVKALDLTGFDHRVAIVDYRDYPENPYGEPGIDYVYNLDQSFSSDKDVIISAIDGLTLGWGNDWKESVHSALVEAMLDVNKDTANSDNYGWREGAFKAIILIGDAPPQGGPESNIPEPWNGGHDPRLACSKTRTS